MLLNLLIAVAGMAWVYWRYHDWQPNPRIQLELLHKDLADLQKGKRR